jgi:hypothetical protein
MLDNPGETDFTQIEAAQLIAEVDTPGTPTRDEVLFLGADYEDGKRNKLDNLLAVRFFKGAVPNFLTWFETKKVVYEDQDMIEIRLPHDQTSVTVRVAQDSDKLRFSDLWSKYIKGEAQGATGTPLAVLKLGPSQLKHLEQAHVTTVEQLAGVTLHFLGAGDLKNRAIAYLMKHDERADEQVKSLAEQNADLLERLAALEAKFSETTKAKK